MEDLIELVAASFARYGIECPASDLRTVPGNPAAAIETANSQVAPTALPEHSYRKKPDASLAT
jgi:hypothetical protein